MSPQYQLQKAHVLWPYKDAGPVSYAAPAGFHYKERNSVVSMPVHVEGSNVDAVIEK